jgi:Tfp pilus assembly protein PilO
MSISRDNLIVLALLAGLTGGYGLVVYRGQSVALADARRRAAECRRQWQSDTEKAAPVAELAREVVAMKRRYDQGWRRRLPPRQELAGFLREIAGHLSEAKLVNRMIQPGRPTRGTLYHCLPITMKFEGSFLELAGFLERVDQMTRLTRVEQLSIAPKGEGDLLAIELGMNIYFTEH